jgi:hypothetical protein
MTSLTCIVYFGVQALYDRFLRNGLSELKKFYKYQRAEIMRTLEQESSWLSEVVVEIQDKLSEICINTEATEHPLDEKQCCDSSCKDVHVTTDISPISCTSPKVCSCKQFAFFSLYVYAEPLCIITGYRNILSEDIDKLLYVTINFSLSHEL